MTLRSPRVTLDLPVAAAGDPGMRGRHALGMWSRTAIPGVVLIAVIVLSAATLVRIPLVYGDEPSIASEAYSFVHGTGFRPTIFAGSGLFDVHHNLWTTYLGTAGFMLPALLAKPSLALYRLVAFLIGLAALGSFASAFRCYGWAVTLTAAAALASSWGFIAASHYVRWDSLAFLIIATVLALLWRGIPGRRTALLLGILIGLGLDIQGSMLGLVPGVMLLLGWSRAERWHRLSIFAGALAALMLVYLGVHYLADPSEAKRQFHLLFPGNTYTPPLERAITTGQPGSLYAGESGRYGEMTFYLADQQYAIYGSLATLGAGALASLLGLARLRSPARRSVYPIAVVPAILFGSYVLGMPLIQGNKGSMMYGWYALPLAIAALAALSFDEQAFLRTAGHRGGALLLAALLAVAGVVGVVVSMLPGAVTLHGLGDEWYAAPFAIAALAAVLSVRWKRGRVEWVLFSLLTLTIAATGYFLSDLAKTKQLVTDPAVQAAFHRYAPSSQTVLAEPVFWFDDPGYGFRSDSVIWLDEAIHHWTFRESVEHVCPAVIVFDSVWLDHYAEIGTDTTFAPTHASEVGVLHQLLADEYRRVHDLSAAGDHMVFWHRSTGCSATSSPTKQ